MIKGDWPDSKSILSFQEQTVRTWIMAVELDIFQSIQQILQCFENKLLIIANRLIKFPNKYLFSLVNFTSFFYIGQRLDQSHAGKKCIKFTKKIWWVNNSKKQFAIVIRFLNRSDCLKLSTRNSLKLKIFWDSKK